jgi:hypothetical protein
MARFPFPWLLACYLLVDMLPLPVNHMLKPGPELSAQVVWVQGPAERYSRRARSSALAASSQGLSHRDISLCN